MKHTLDAPIELQTGPQPQLSVIWMHGLGADGSDFPPIVPELGLPEDVDIRFVFPHAPKMPVSCNGGYVMRAWFDIVSMDGGKRDVDAQTVIDSVELVRELIEKEKARGIPSERIVLAGFSQGGAMAYTVGLTYAERLGGIMVLSGYLPTPQWVRDNYQAANRHTPIFAAHGELDDVLPLALGEAARDFASELNDAMEWHSWPMAHTLCLQEVQAIGKWLTARLAAA